MMLLFCLGMVAPGVVLPPMPVILKGTLRGSLEIEMSLQMRDGDFYGFYHHRDYAGMLSLAGSMDRIGLLRLREFDGTGAQTATLEGRFLTPTHFKGTRREEGGVGMAPFDLQVAATQAFNPDRAALSHHHLFWESPNKDVVLDLDYPLVSAHASNDVMKAINHALNDAFLFNDPKALVDFASFFSPSNLKVRYQVTFNVHGFLCIVFRMSDGDEDVAQPTEDMECLVFDLRDGRQLSLGDFFEASALPAVTRHIQTTARDHYRAKIGAEADLDRKQSLEDMVGFILKEDGIYLIDLFTDGPASGLEVPLPYTGLRPWLKPAFRDRLLKGTQP